MNTLKILLPTLVGLFVLMSLLPYGTRENPKTDPSLSLKAPKEVMEIFKRSCYDCHSNQTRWPWYSYVFPMSWSVMDHVKNGRLALNFDEWNSYSQKKKFKLKDAIAQKTGTTMPLKDYLWAHSEAKISKKEKEIVEKWAYGEE